MVPLVVVVVVVHNIATCNNDVGVMHSTSPEHPLE